MAFDFDKSLTQIPSLVGVAAEDVQAMGVAARTMAAETGKSANEAAQALFFITSAGLRGSDAMDVLDASLKASAVGLGETRIVADLATSAMNAFGKENLSATDATDVLVAAVREGKLLSEELAGAMGSVYLSHQIWVFHLMKWVLPLLQCPERVQTLHLHQHN